MILIYLLVEFWPVTLIVFLVSVFAGVFTKDVTRVMVLLPAAGLVLVALLIGGYLVSDKLNDQRLDKSYEHRQQVLTAPRTIGGLEFPAGTKLLWDDDALTKLETATLPHPSRLWGVMISGEVKPQSEFWNELTLAEDTDISGWRCRAGEIQLRLDGSLERCELARAQVVSRLPATGKALYPSLTIPAGTKLEMSPGSDTGVEFVLPEDQPLTLPDVGAKLPGGSFLHLYLNNAVRSATGSAERPFAVDGIEFTDSTSWMYPEELDDDAPGPHSAATGVSGQFRQDVQCGGKLYKSDDYPYVRVYTGERALMFTYVKDDEPVRTEKVPLASCRVLPHRTNQQ